MADIIFSTSEGESVPSLAHAVYHCYGAFEKRIAELAAAQGVPWERRPEGSEDAEGLAEMCSVHALELAHSILAREGARGPIVGVALLGRRGERGWLGDFAVAPERRGQGLGHRLMAAFLEQARSLNIRSIEFDVLAVNTPALRVYEAAGFRRDQRPDGRPSGRMDRFLANARGLQTDARASRQLQVAPLPRESIARWYIETMADQPPPCWERQLPSLLAYSDTRAVVVSEAGREKAALVYALDLHPGQRVRPLLRIVFAGFRAGASAPHLRALLAEAARGAGDEADISAGLEPTDSRLASLLRELGFRQTRPAYNMRREL